MSQRKKRKLEEIDQEISQCKGNINLTEGQIINSLSKFNTPKKEAGGTYQDPQTSDTLLRSTTGPIKKPTKNQDQNQQQIVKYVKNMSRLKDNLEEKTYIIEVEHQKDRLQLQNQIQQLQIQINNLSNKLDKQESEINQKNDTIIILKNHNGQLELLLKEKQTKITELSQQLSLLRTQSTKTKLQLKNVKADNKVIMNHIDRLSSEVKAYQNKKDPLSQRQKRVMKSLYQETLPNVEIKQKRRRDDAISELTNKILLQDTTDRNGELKTLIRRLNEEIEILKKQKQLLIIQNQQKTLNFQNQKTITNMTEQSNEKLNGIIMKMGQKILSLQVLNETLQQSLRKLGEGQETDQNYYRQTKIKAGQFYYRR